MLTRAAFLAGLAASALAGAGPKTYRVVIEKMAYVPAQLTVRPGDTVVFENRDIFRHTATAKGGAFNLVLTPRASGQVVLAKAGAVAVYCAFHPGMTAQIVVG